MHEASLALNIYDILVEEMYKYPESKLNRVFVDIGEFTHIDPEALKFAFEITLDNSPLKGAKMEIKKIPLILNCKECKKEFSGDGINFRCAYCNSNKVEILTGREFRITELEID